MQKLSNQDSQPTTRCKLCASFQASGFPTVGELWREGSDSFTRHADLCDACIGHDYAAKRRWGTLEQWAGLTFGMIIALLGTFPVLKLFRRELIDLLSPLPNFVRLPAAMILAWIAIGVPSIVLCWLLIHALLYVLMRRSKVDSNDSDVAIDIERFRWLAEWGAATGHDRFRRRMLKQMSRLNRHELNRS